jgi:hypothetical protein
MTTKKPPRYQEGDVFGVPVGAMGHCPLLIIRKSAVGREGHKLLFVWVFEPQALDKLLMVPPVSPLTLRPHAITLTSVGDAPIVSGRWPRLGTLTGFSRDVWPLPPLSRHTPGTSTAYLDILDPRDLATFVEVSPLPIEDVSRFPHNEVQGSLFLEARASKILRGERPRPQYDFDRFLPPFTTREVPRKD